MPRFFFHVFDEAAFRDDDGLELADSQAAHRVALAGARAMMCDQLKQGRLKLHHRIEVENEAGEEIFRLAFGDAVSIETDGG